MWPGSPTTSRSNSFRITWAALVLVLSAGAVGRAQGPAAMAGAVEPRMLAALSWRSIGPFRGGRSIAGAGSASRPFEYYFGATGGGLWKTTDGGTAGRRGGR